jgi:sugar lactone lactonase YvrE
MIHRASSIQSTLLPSTRSLLGESPRWDTARGLIHWLDIPRGIVRSLSTATGVESALCTDSPCGSLALDDRGGLVVACGDGWHRVGQEPTEVRVSLGTPAMRFNDAGVDSQGRLWSATMRADEDLSEPAEGRLYRVDGSAFTPFGPALVAGNGIAWSPDDEWMYCVDSAPNVVWRAAFDAQRGVATDFRPWARLDTGMADGIAIDEAGGVWVALWGTGQVNRIGSDGVVTHVVEVPTPNVTALAFIGPRLTTMVITTAAMDAPADDSHAGSLFLADAPYAGLPLHRTTWRGLVHEVTP